MIIINAVNNERFSLNGIEYFKNFLSFVAGDKVAIYNAYDKSDQRIELAHYSEFNVNGVVYGSAALLQTALINVIYTRDSLGAVNTVLQGSITTSSTPTGTGVAFWVATQAGTYTNFGGVVVNSNSFAVISRNAAGAFSISQTALDITSKVNVSDIVDNLTTDSATKVASARQVKVLNEKVANKADLVVGKNKYNVATSVSGYYIDANVQINNASYTTSDFIAVTALSQYTSNLRIRFVNYYNSNKVFVSGGSSDGTNNGVLTFTPSSGVSFVKISINTTISNPNLLQLELGSVATAYQSYLNAVPTSQVDLSEYTKTADIESVLNGKVPTLIVGKNTFDKSLATIGSYIASNGSIFANATYDYSGYIPVTSLTQYSSNYNMRFVSYYDSSKVLVAGGSTSDTKTFTTPANVVFVRITLYHTDINNFMLVLGTAIPTTYQSYKKVVSDSNLELFASKIIMDTSLTTNTFKLFLPKEVCIAVGRTIELYHSQISWCGNINDYAFVWSGVGKSMKRKWTCTGATIGTNVLTLKVYDKNNLLIATATTNVRVVSATISTPFTITAIGDSLSNQKPWNAEVRALSSNTISFVGTRNSGTSEGRSGATSSYYLGNNSYTFDSLGIAGNDGRTQDLNPFYNPSISNVDFAYYKSNYNQNPDKLLIWLGTNGITVDPISNATNIKTFIDRIRATGGSTIKIYVVHTLFRANQDGIGKQLGTDGYVVNTTYKLEEDLKVFNLQERMLSDLTGYANVYLVPVSTCHDSEFNFGAVSTAVNPRASQVEFLPVEATHPQTQGYMQIADIIFSSLAANQ